MNNSFVEQPFVFILLALAVYRVSHLVTSEEGPFESIARVRTLLGGDTQRDWLGRGIVCILCVSFWVAWLGALAVWFWDVSFVQFFIYGLALSGAVLAFKKVTR